MKILRPFRSYLLFTNCFQPGEFILKNIYSIFLYSTRLRRHPVERGNETHAFHANSCALLAFVFLFFGVLEICYGKLSNPGIQAAITAIDLQAITRQPGTQTVSVLHGKPYSIQANQGPSEKKFNRPVASGTPCLNPVSADAGPMKDSICLGQSLSLNGVANGDFTSVVWTSSGDGTFSPDAFALNAVYYPGTLDSLNMTFTLTLTANANAPCISATDEIEVLILDLPVTTTTSNSPVCEGSALDLAAGGGNFFLWTGPNGYTGFNIDTTIFPVALNQSGTYYVTVTNESGCSKIDSVIVLLNPVSNSIGNPIVACDSATLPWGETVTVTNDYHMIYTAANGCDSIVTVHVSINNNTGDTTASFCGHFTWYGADYTTSGDKVHVLQGGNAQGCDSVITLHLTIPPVDDGFACSIDACNTLTGVVTHDYSACTATLNVKAYIEGFYGPEKKMLPVMLNQGVPGATEAAVDSVTIELHSVSDFSVILDQYKAVIDTGGNVSGILNSSSIGTHYYLAFRHRNSVLTCSANPVFLNVVTIYDFTTNQDSTYGGNVIIDSFNDGKWLIYSGEVSIPFQDEFIGTDDVTNVDNDNISGLSFFNSDYFELYKDISGDGYLGTDDVTITNNNNLSDIYSLHP